MSIVDHMSVRIGVPGVDVAPGDHICAFYPSLGERDEILMPFLAEGLRAGEKCVAVLDVDAPTDMQAALLRELESTTTRANQLQVQPSKDTYLDGGQFDVDAMLRFWEETLVGTEADGYSFARVVGEMTWALSNMPGVEEFVSYEARLNRLLPGHPQVLLCLYELDRFDGALLVDVLKTHPKVLLGGMLLDNPYYLEPEEFLANR